MSDGQTELGESIQQQNVPPVSIRLERGESVRWHDGQQWRVGHVLMLQPNYAATCFGKMLVQTPTGIYPVHESKLQPYPPRCERCGGDQIVKNYINGFTWTEEPCPACLGSERSKP